MSTVEDEDAFIRTAAGMPKPRPHRLRAILAMFMLQYAMVAIMVCLAVVYILRYMVTPQIVARFEMIAAALKR